MPGIVPGAEQMDQQAKFSALWNQHFNGGRESEQANRSIIHFQDMKAGGGQGLRVLWPSVWCDIPPSPFNPHEDIKVMNTLRLADSWPALRNWVQWNHPIPNQKKIAFSHWGNHQLERLEQRIPWKLSWEVTSSGDAEQHNKTEVNTQNWAKCKVTIDHMPLILFKHLRIWTAALVKSMAYMCSPQEPWPVPSNFRHRSQIRVETRGSLRHCIWCRITYSHVRVFGTKPIGYKINISATVCVQLKVFLFSFCIYIFLLFVIFSFRLLIFQLPMLSVILNIRLNTSRNWSSNFQREANFKTLLSIFIKISKTCYLIHYLI